VILHRDLILSVHPASRRDWRLAGGVIVVSTLAFLAAVPFAKVHLAAVPGFILVYQSALVVNDLITALLLFGLFTMGRSRALLALASGYTFTAFVAVAHGLTFPGGFGATGWLGAGSQSTVWLYMFWHGGFPLFVIAYARLRGRGGVDWPTRIRPGAAVASSVGAVFIAACGFTALVTAGHGTLPTLIGNGAYTPAYTLVVTIVWLLSVAAAWTLWQRDPHSILDAWLLAVMCAWIFEIALSAILNESRFDLGFYAGRAFGFAAATFVLAVLLLENGRLYARLADSYDQVVAANKELDAFSYSVSHDLRAPVRAIKGFAAILDEQHGTRLDADGRRLTTAIRESADRCGQLIEDLLTFARLGRQPLATRKVELDALVRQAIQELGDAANGRRIEFEVGELGSADADPALLKQALANLLGNAIKFTRDRDPAVIEVGRRQDAAVFYVKDNGVGFDMRESGRLFGVFQRLASARDYEGTGVGLAIVHKVVERHGGRVWAEASPGAGATFFFTLAAA
jgi:signal transduction histidine kinase